MKIYCWSNELCRYIYCMFMNSCPLLYNKLSISFEYNIYFFNSKLWSIKKIPLYCKLPQIVQNSAIWDFGYLGLRSSGTAPGSSPLIIIINNWMTKWQTNIDKNRLMSVYVYPIIIIMIKENTFNILMNREKLLIYRQFVRNLQMRNTK